MIDIPNNDLGQHGGNISFITKHYPNAPTPLIDLSTGINPYPYPIIFQNSQINHLADLTEMQHAINKAALYYSTQPENVTISSGMQPLMFALASLRRQEAGISNINILGPTYSEYEKLWKAAGHIVNTVDSIDKLLRADVIIICNPNNPDGRTLKPEILLQLADMLARKDGWLIVDESFADLMVEISVSAHVSERKNMIVMRSCGKFFGIAGLRASSVIAPVKINTWLRTVIGDWPISTTACNTLPKMFTDDEWIAQNKVKLSQESEIWRNILSKYFTIIGYTDLFTLVETKDSDYWYKKLASQGILIRKFDYNPKWLRFGLPMATDITRITKAFS